MAQSIAMQTLELEAEPPKRLGPREIGLPWSLLIIPVLFVAAGLSIPVTFVAARIMRRRERAFRGRMHSVGRVIEWSDFLRAVDQKSGTFIEERYSLKGPVRWWWTSEDVYQVCPYAMVDWMTMLKNARFRPVSEWFRQQYTSPDEGRAVLVSTEKVSKEEVHAFRSRLESESGTERWTAVVPPESFRRR